MIFKDYHATIKSDLFKIQMRQRFKVQEKILILMYTILLILFSTPLKNLQPTY